VTALELLESLNLLDENERIAQASRSIWIARGRLIVSAYSGEDDRSFRLNVTAAQ